jgi:hypothetical protein
VELSLSGELAGELESVFPPDVAAGERYVPAMKALLNG